MKYLMNWNCELRSVKIWWNTFVKNGSPAAERFTWNIIAYFERFKENWNHFREETRQRQKNKRSKSNRLLRQNGPFVWLTMCVRVYHEKHLQSAPPSMKIYESFAHFLLMNAHSPFGSFFYFWFDSFGFVLHISIFDAPHTQQTTTISSKRE